MREFRLLTEEEIRILENRSCWAEDWSSVNVAEGFNPNYLHRVMLYGHIYLGIFEESLEVSKVFFKHSGIYSAILRNVTIGDNSLIENIGNYINNYTIGERCLISNIGTLETTEGATYGEGNVISVLNEIGEGNIILFRELSSQLAAFMVQHSQDKMLRDAIRRIIKEDITLHQPDQGWIGNNVKIVNTKEITNTVIFDECEMNGTSRLSDCTILSSNNANVYIGTSVICENSIILHGTAINNGAKIQNCFVGEACQITNGFTASSSVFFANCYMSNGEAGAAFCGPFTTSHHKSSLLIGAMFSFYNAESATNFNNHAYKMGPIHYGILQRGCKTACDTCLMLPANIGTYSICFGKLPHHPDTRKLPFSHLTGYGDVMHLSPGKNIATVGLYRDIHKWSKRDLRIPESNTSIVNFDWLSPYAVGQIVEGKKVLEKLRNASGEHVSTYNYEGFSIDKDALKKGIQYYDMALRIYMGTVLKRMMKTNSLLAPPETNKGMGEWTDLSGLLLPISEEERMKDDIKNGSLETIGDIQGRLHEIHSHYFEYQWVWTYHLITDYYHLDNIHLSDAERVLAEYVTAHRTWIAEIRKDAEKEFAMGDVEQDVFDHFIERLDREADYES